MLSFFVMSRQDTEVAFLAKRNKAVKAGTKLRRVEAVVDAAAAAADAIIQCDASLQAEIEFQHAKQYANKCNAYLENTLLASEVPEDLGDVALAMAQIREGNRAKKVRREGRQAALMHPTGLDWRFSTVWFEDAEWQELLPLGLLHNVVADISEANVWVVLDAASPPEDVLWTATLQGGTIVDVVFAETNRQGGVAFRYDQATLIQRHVLISPEFDAAERRLASLVRTAARKATSKWTLLPSWEAFSEKYEQLAGPDVAVKRRQPMRVLTCSGVRANRNRHVHEECARESISCCLLFTVCLCSARSMIP